MFLVILFFLCLLIIGLCVLDEAWAEPGTYYKSGKLYKDFSPVPGSKIKLKGNKYRVYKDFAPVPGEYYKAKDIPEQAPEENYDVDYHPDYRKNYNPYGDY